MVVSNSRVSNAYLHISFSIGKWLIWRPVEDHHLATCAYCSIHKGAILTTMLQKNLLFMLFKIFELNIIKASKMTFRITNNSVYL